MLCAWFQRRAAGSRAESTSAHGRNRLNMAKNVSRSEWRGRNLGWRRHGLNTERAGGGSIPNGRGGRVCDGATERSSASNLAALSAIIHEQTTRLEWKVPNTRGGGIGEKIAQVDASIRRSSRGARRTGCDVRLSGVPARDRCAAGRRSRVSRTDAGQPAATMAKSTLLVLEEC